MGAVKSREKYGKRKGKGERIDEKRKDGDASGKKMRKGKDRKRTKVKKNCI